LQGQVSGSHQIVDLVEAWLTRTFPGSLVVFQPSSELLGLLDLTHQPEKIVPVLQQVLREIPNSTRFLLGISNQYSALRDYHQAYEEARDALAHAQQFQESRICEVNEIGPLRFLKIRDARGMKATDPYSLTIQKLAQYDQQYSADLVYTLDIFLQAGGRFSNAARMMSAEPGKSIAVGTVRQRVERMCEITSMDLLDSTLWLNLQLAIKVHKAQV
ncbi:MAG: PucR family transcriptional regulator, partial [Ktedonobacteraceae bacterium]